MTGVQIRPAGNDDAGQAAQQQAELAPDDGGARIPEAGQEVTVSDDNRDQVFGIHHVGGIGRHVLMARAWWDTESVRVNGGPSSNDTKT